MANDKKIVMAELSDIRYDARVLKEANSLAKKGYHVTLVMYNTDILRIQNNSVGNISKVEIPFKKRYQKKRYASNLLRFFQFAKILTAYIRVIFSLEADYYHAHNYYVGWIVYLSSIIHNGIFVYDQHEIDWDQTGIIYKIGCLLEKYLISKAQLVICPSEDRSKLIKEYNHLAVQPLVLNNYPTASIVTVAGTKRSLRSELSLSENSPILIYTGMLSIATRMQENVIKALTRLPKEVVFVIIGFGHDDEIARLQSTADDSQVQDRIFILPPKPHSTLLEYTKCADIGICLLKSDRIANKYHALNKFYEYTASGVAVLGSKSPTFENEIYKNSIGRIGSTCDEEDPEQIAAGLGEIIGNVSLLGLCKTNARLAFESLWNWERQENKLTDSYDTLG